MAPNAPASREKVFLYCEVAVGILIAAVVLSCWSELNIALAKYLAFALICGLFAMAPFRLFSAKRLLLLVGLVFFPVTLTFGGKDAIGSASLLILLMACFYAFGFLLADRSRIQVERVGWIALLIVIALIDALRARRAYIGPELRHFLNFATSGLLFLMLINTPSLCGIKRGSMAQKLLSVIVFLVAAEVCLGLLAMYLPFGSRMFRVFLVRTKEELLSVGDSISAIRLSTFNMASEELGEILAMMCPLVFYLALNRGARYWGVFLLLGVGLLFVNTRSCILLALASTLIMLVGYGCRVRVKNLLVFAAGAAATVILLGVLAPSVLVGVAKHMSVAVSGVHRGQGLITVFNRDFVWPDAWRVTKSTLSWFGNGPAPSRVVGLNEYNMHNLYLTLVYQFGIAGSLVYLGLPLLVLGGLTLGAIRSGENLRRFKWACALSLLLFFINEIKFEFNRSDSYQQVIWVMFALYYLVARMKDSELSANAVSVSARQVAGGEAAIR